MNEDGEVIGPGHPEFWHPGVFAPQSMVQAKAGGMVPFRLWSHQDILAVAVMRCYAENRWLVHVKARQTGSSTLFTMIATQHACFRLGCRVAILAHKKAVAMALASIAIRTHRTLPDAIRPRKLPGKKRSLELPDLDSAVDFYSVKDDEPLRGNTVQVLLATEISSWGALAGPDAWTSALNAVSDEGGFVIGESTPKHFGDELHQVCVESEVPGSRWLKVFIPWTKVEAYAKRAPPGWRPSKVVYDYAQKYGLTESQAYWMQTVGLEKCRNRMDKFRAEYPIDEDDCWLITGEAIFNVDKLMAMRQVLDGGTGMLAEAKSYVEYVPPLIGHRYVIFVDPASGLTERDKFGIQVLDIDGYEQVAEYLGHAEAHKVARFVAKLHERFNGARIYVEANGVGEATLSHLLRMGLKRHLFHRRPAQDSTSDKKIPGWYSTTQKKSEAISFLQETIDDDSLIVHSVRFIRQALNYRGDPKARDAKGGHFDLVSAMAGAIWAVRYELGRARRTESTVRSTEERSRLAVERILRLVESPKSGRQTRWGEHL